MFSTKLSAVHPGLRWAAVVPAFLAGYLLPGFVLRVTYEFFGLGIPGVEQILQEAAGGFCAVWFGACTAPKQHRLVALLATGLVILLAGFSMAWIIDSSAGPWGLV